MPEENKPWEQYSGEQKPWQSYSKDNYARHTEYGLLDKSPDNQLENTLNDIVNTSKSPILDQDKDIFRDILKNSNASPEQARESIQTLQGYHEKQKDGYTSYYL